MSVTLEVMSNPNEEVSSDELTQERTRMIIDTSKAMLLAVEMRAIRMSVQARRRITKSEAVNAILADALAEELAETENAESPQPRPRKKRG